MMKNKLLLLLALLMTAATGAWAQEQWDVVWDFTAWSTETVTALKADAAASKLEGWSDVEKKTDAEAGADPDAAAKDNCFWFDGTVNEDGSLSANGAVIKELKGLKFNSDYAAKRSLAIAVNYPSTSLGEYAGGAYLLLGGGGSKQTFPCFTIPGVKAGSKITIEVESHKPSSARGIGLYKNSYAAENLIGEQFKPTAKEVKTWEIAEDCDVVVWNTSNCHIYTIKVKAPAAAPAGYTVSLKDGVKDADKWTVSPNPAPEGSPVTIQYNGRLKVKGVTATSDAAPAANIVDLSKLTADYEAKDGETLTGTLAGNYKISIADGATVTLDGVTINGVNDGSYEWAGITCLGDATIILSGTNTVKGFYEDYPGIQAAADKTLIINGTGSLTASNYGWSAGIGGGNGVACGNIEIQGGTITATSGGLGAGIGGGYNASCGNITISGGTVNAIGGDDGAGIGGGYNASWGNITISGGIVNATGGEYGAGIGGGKRGAASFSCGNIIISGGTVTATGGNNAPGIGGGRGNNNKTLSSCGDITIANTVTKVTATAGEDAPNSIGAGYWGNCGTVTIGGVEGAITTSPYTYDPTAPAKEPATVTTAPTGAAIVGRLNTNSTALVSGGVADGGKLMYAVTTTNTKPTSTAGFSDAVPTAKDITASGKVYVWYYVKGDDTHSDSEIAATAIEVPVADIVWDRTNVSDLGVFEGDPYEKEGVTLRSNGENVFAWWDDFGDPTRDGIEFEAEQSGGYTFTAPTGKAFTKIEMTLTEPWGWDSANLGTGWAYNNSTVTWKGTAAASTVELLTDDIFAGATVKSIVFYLSE